MDTKAMGETLDKIHSGIAGMNANIDKRFKEFDERMTEYEIVANRPMGGGGMKASKADQEYAANFTKYLRSGRVSADLEQRAGVTVADAEKLGYLAPPDFVASVWERIRSLSTIRGKATVLTTGSSAVQLPVENKFSDASWVGEVETRPDSPEPTVKLATIPVNKLSCRMPISNNLLEDAVFDIDSYIASRLVDAIAFKENDAFVRGDGALKPKGFTTYTTVPAQMSGVAATLGANFDPFIDAWAKLPEGYHPGAEWYMNLRTAAVLRKLKDTQGRMLWQEPVQAGQPTTLLGFSVNFIEQMPDIAAGASPVYFGNMRKAYAIVDRVGLGLQRADQEMARQDMTVMYARRRTGGQLILPEALVRVQVGV